MRIAGPTTTRLDKCQIPHEIPCLNSFALKASLFSLRPISFRFPLLRLAKDVLKRPQEIDIQLPAPLSFFHDDLPGMVTV